MTFPTEWNNQNVPKHQPEKKGQRHLSHPFQAIDHGVHQDFHRIFNATQRTEAIRHGIPAIGPPTLIGKNWLNWLNKTVTQVMPLVDILAQ